MANGPQDYRDPKVTTAASRSSNWLWYLVGAILLLLLLGWLLGLFGAADDDTAVTDQPAATEGAAATDATATDGTAADDAAATDGAAATEEAPDE